MLYINRKFNNFSKGKYYTIIKENIEKHSISILESIPALSKEFWRVAINLMWFNKKLSKELFKILKQRAISKIKMIKKY